MTRQIDRQTDRPTNRPADTDRPGHREVTLPIRYRYIRSFYINLNGFGKHRLTWGIPFSLVGKANFPFFGKMHKRQKAKKKQSTHTLTTNTFHEESESSILLHAIVWILL